MTSQSSCDLGIGFLWRRVSLNCASYRGVSIAEDYGADMTAGHAHGPTDIAIRSDIVLGADDRARGRSPSVIMKAAVHHR